MSTSGCSRAWLYILLPFVYWVMVGQGCPGKLLQACSRGRGDRSLLNLCLRYENLGDPTNRIGSCLQG